MSKTILIVDDHANTRTLVTDYLAAQDYRVLSARDGVEALAVARRTPPDLILLDVMMPRLDGFEFIRAYRRESNVPIIVLTARVAGPDKGAGLEVGAGAYPTTPVGME